MVVLMPIINGPLEQAGIVISETELEHFLYVFLGVGGIGATKAAHTKYVQTRAPKRGFGGMDNGTANTQAPVPAPVITPVATTTTTVTTKQSPEASGSSGEKEISSDAQPATPNATPATTTIISTTTTPAAAEVTLPPPVAAGIAQATVAPAAVQAAPKAAPAISDIVFVPPGSRYQTNFESDPNKGNVIQYGTGYVYARMKGARSYTSMVLRDADKNIIDVTQSNVDVETCRIRLANKDGTPLQRGIYSIQVRADAGTGDSSGVTDDEFEIV